MNFKIIFIDALITTILVFLLGYSLNVYFDNQRISKLLYTSNFDSVNHDALELNLLFKSAFYDKEQFCKTFKEQIQEYRKSISRYGNTLEGYGSLAKFYKDIYKIFQRDYYFSQLNVYYLLNNLNSICTEYYQINTIFFIYELNNERDVLQGYAIEQYIKDKEEYFSISLSTEFSKTLNLYNASLLIFSTKNFTRNETPLIVGKRLEDFFNTTLTNEEYYKRYKK
ncbi:MAG: hypothetical protein QXS41_02070 [Candidatus Woesearchaeota archaeon]